MRKLFKSSLSVPLLLIVACFLGALEREDASASPEEKA